MQPWRELSCLKLVWPSKNKLFQPIVHRRMFKPKTGYWTEWSHPFLFITPTFYIMLCIILFVTVFLYFDFHRLFLTVIYKKCNWRGKNHITEKTMPPCKILISCICIESFSFMSLFPVLDFLFLFFTQLYLSLYSVVLISCE